MQRIQRLLLTVPLLVRKLPEWAMAQRVAQISRPARSTGNRRHARGFGTMFLTLPLTALGTVVGASQSLHREPGYSPVYPSRP
jgi:hypothetical protein